MSHYQLSLPVDLGAGLEVTPKNLEHYYNHTEKSSPSGFFPFGISREWHSGIHLCPDPNTTVHACADGVVIAARLEDSRSAFLEKHGCTNFILIQHSVPENPEEKWYSLYFHLSHQAMDSPDESLRTVSWIHRTNIASLRRGGVQKIENLPVKAGDPIHFSGLRRDGKEEPTYGAIHWETFCEKHLFHDMETVSDDPCYWDENLATVLKQLDPKIKPPKDRDSVKTREAWF